MKKMKAILLLTACIFMTISVCAQNKTITQNIRGIVTDRQSGEPLPYINVELTDMPEYGATTNENGSFSINNVPVGRHNLKVSSLGYERNIIREILLTSAKEVYLEIQLSESLQQLQEITVTPKTNKEQPLNNMALTGARMFSVEEANRYAGGFDDPARLASSFAGVSPAVGNNGISIHGNAPHLLQWRLEDVEIPNPNHFADIATLGGGILSSLSSNVLGNSDFFTGAFPAEYGNAVSGVFDMKLRNGNNQNYEHTFQAGILGLDFASEGPLSRNHNSSYIFNYRYSTTSLFKKLGAGMDEVLDFQDLNFKLNFPTKAGIFSVWGTGFIDKYDNEPEKNTDEWESNEDRTLSEAKQTSAAAGVTHRYFFGGDAQLKTTLATTYSKQDTGIDVYDYDLNSTPLMRLTSRNTNLILKTSFNKKISSRFTNQTGLNYTKLFYDMNFDLAPHYEKPMDNISDGKGNTDLISAYNSSLIGLSDNVMLGIGANAQLLRLNNEWTLEPRVSVKWQASNSSTFALAYGLHSRMEKMDVYFVKAKGSDQLVNENLSFTKSHHINLSYDYKISDDMHIRIEPFAQFLYNVPVMADSSYSVLNRSTFYVEDPLVNKGKGRNIGVDLTFEKYLTKGLYYMVTASVFDSRYSGGDGVWHNTKYNRNFIVNGLIGKEWMMGENKQNILSVNLKLTLQGGERYSPINAGATMDDPDKIVQYDETKAYSKKLSPMFLANYTISYKINKKNVSHEFAIKGLNATGYEEFYGHVYNFKKDEIEPYRGSTSLTNISYKIQF